MMRAENEREKVKEERVGEEGRKGEMVNISEEKRRKELEREQREE